jgi:hypothetical protein
MAKQKVPSDAVERVSGTVLMKRKLVAPDETLLAAIPVDYATMTGTQDAVVHSLYQVRLPVVATPPHEVEAALVGRFQYGPSHFRGLVALAIRQFLILEKSLGRADEDSISFLQTQISEAIEALRSDDDQGQVP